MFDSNCWSNLFGSEPENWPLQAKPSPQVCFICDFCSLRRFSHQHGPRNEISYKNSRCLTFSLAKGKKLAVLHPLSSMAAVLGNEKWWPWVEKLCSRRSRTVPFLRWQALLLKAINFVLWDQPRRLFRVEIYFFSKRCQKHDPLQLETHPFLQ